ncbi:hypothetical protein Vadar_024470 [Vaccinium darrowii]|uniref:Uncharacterized protein n=1 Tax=Vaccinium darrowii TaxID=229202 RepID=A0ACB7XSN5_9ERIC|nr:hypothetical protein Vadar_024470 [Vaccinium darrowii]
MGILDSIYSAAYSTYSATYSATEKAKQIAPDLTPVTDACRSSCDFSRTAVTRINRAFMEKVVPTLNHYVYEEEGRAKTSRVAASFAKNAAFEGLKWVPGGVPIWNIVSPSLRDAKNEDYKEVVKNLQARIDILERESSGSKNIPDDVKLEREASVFKMNQADVKFESRVVPGSNSNTNLKPDDVIRIFMMKEVYGGNMFDDLGAPGIRHGKISRKKP